MTNKLIGERIKEMVERGIRWSRIEQDLNISGSTISYHLNRHNLKPDTLPHRNFNWKAIQQFYKNHTLVETSKKFHISTTSLRDNAKRGKFVLGDPSSPERMEITKRARNNSSRCWSLEEVFCEFSPVLGSNLKSKLKTNPQLLPYGCSNEECLLYKSAKPMWANKLIKLHLDHINGIRNDNRLENLRWLCPNCHSQTETYCGRNKHKRDSI